MKRFGCLALVFGIVVFARATAGATVYPEQARSKGFFSARLDADKSVYHVGEPVQVRLAITNDSDGEYGISYLPPWLLGSLSVLDYKNQTIPLTLTPHSRAWRGSLADAVFLKPGESCVISYYVGDALKGWTPISFWGYDLEKPGIYELSMMLNLRAWLITDHAPTFFYVSVLSNTAQIRVH